ncbi:arginase family protein [Yinghuangia soli]|uniref:Arginase family protein n=1 Tax=Yinghuangia soli TaxID=2908204 RepID=A0AA41PXC3_9ACTN|nr:arginase family protein [Yinghuangia soli]MCF2527584.1 arginase family protein [Yinghuangia soli]
MGSAAEPAVLIVPQWQGSSAAAPKLLVDGAYGSARLLRAGLAVAVPAEDPAPDALVRNAAAVRDRLAGTAPDQVVVTLGGDCGVELEPVAAAVGRYGTDLAVVWLDAHGDLNTPEESPSGAFHGMVLRTLLGAGPVELLPPADRRLSPDQVVLGGTRALDAGERAYIGAHGVRTIPVAALAGPEALAEAVAATGAAHLYVHVDLDVMDPHEFDGLSYPEPDGITAAQLCAAVAALAARFTLVGLGVTEHAPSGDAAAAEADAQVLRDLFTAAGLGALLR